ncbi:hypothetical protein SAY87_014406 [Trapa incisa]|uniref:Uncharacterized protein n=1 Tax=Trapa incisa TaxID=236973 RepID=A0AAN7JL53_9MYRT|nr:hypothetical protein SAY87_014406 [Trapa incisa]
MAIRVKCSSATATILLVAAFFLTHMLHSAEGIRPLLTDVPDGPLAPAGDAVDRRLIHGPVTASGSPGLRLSLVETHDSGPSPGGGGHRLEASAATQQNSGAAYTPRAPSGGKS